MSLLCGGGGGGDGAAEKSPEEMQADAELKKMQKESESTDQKVSVPPKDIRARHRVEGGEGEECIWRGVLGGEVAGMCKYHSFHTQWSCSRELY